MTKKASRTSKTFQPVKELIEALCLEEGDSSLETFLRGENSFCPETAVLAKARNIEVQILGEEIWQVDVLNDGTAITYLVDGHPLAPLVRALHAGATPTPWLGGMAPPKFWCN